MRKCPVSALSVSEKPHWKAAHTQRGYLTKFSLIGPDIIHGEIVANHDVIMDYIDNKLFQTIIKESNLTGKAIHMLFNLNHVKGISFMYKKDLVNLLYNSGPIFKLLVIYNVDHEIHSMVETFAAIAPEESTIVNVGSYQEAVQLILDSKSGKLEPEPYESDEEQQYNTYKKEFLSALARFHWLNLPNHPITMPESRNQLYPFFKALEALQQDLRDKENLYLKEQKKIAEEYEKKITEKNILLNAQEALNKKIESQLEREKSSLICQIAARDMELKQMSSIMSEKRLKIELIESLVGQMNIEPVLKKQITVCCRELADHYNRNECKTDKEITVADSILISKLQRRHPDLSKRDLSISLMIKQNYSTTEIAHAIGITPRGVESVRYRLHKKLGLAKHESIKNYLLDMANS